MLRFAAGIRPCGCSAVANYSGMLYSSMSTSNVSEEIDEQNHPIIWCIFCRSVLFLTGNGLLNTLLSTRMAMEGVSVVTNGIVLSCYFTGLLVGSFFCRHPIESVGPVCQ
jgi:hypothetical protein